jgi:PIN domain nuclease of toxin-antitoxin system
LRLLIDTHVLIWSVTSTAKLSARARSLLENASHERLFSAVSIWEVAIKAALRKPGFDVEANDLLASVTARAASRVPSLPLHHRDPFDRLLVAQAIEEDARLLTADATLALYGPNILTLA